MERNFSDESFIRDEKQLGTSTRTEHELEDPTLSFFPDDIHVHNLDTSKTHTHTQSIKSSIDRRAMIKEMKQEIRKVDRKVKHRAMKQKDLDRAINSTLASPPSKMKVSHVVDSRGKVEPVRAVLSWIEKLIGQGALQSETLFDGVCALKTLFSNANKDKNDAAKSIYQLLTPADCDMLARLISREVALPTQITTIGIFLQLSYSQFSHLLLQSCHALETIATALFCTNNALRVRAVCCIANLAHDGNIRDFLLGIPKVIAGLVQNLEFDIRTHKNNMDLVTVARDTCWAINNFFAAEPATSFAKMRPLLHPLIKFIVRVERWSLTKEDDVENLIRYALRAVENALDAAKRENIDTHVLHQDKRFVHFLSWCIRFRRNEKTRDIALTALNCICHFPMGAFLEENLITDFHRTLLDERHKKAKATPFLTALCMALACMMKNGMSDEMKPHTVKRIVNGLTILTNSTLSCGSHDLRRNACLALSVLGRSIRRTEYIDSFWFSGGGCGLNAALSLDVESSVNHQALLALDALLSFTPSNPNKNLQSKPQLRDSLKDSVEKLLYTQNETINNAANVVLSKLELLEDSENHVSSLAQSDLKPVQAPAPKRRRVEFGDLNSNETSSSD